MSFQLALEHMLKFEGGYANDRDDSGGETFKGVSRNNWPKWPGWALIDKVKAAGARTARLINACFDRNEEMDSLVAEFYRANFWEPWERHDLPSRLTEKLFDTAVNMGQSRAAKLVQRAVNDLGQMPPLVEDGSVGPLTLAGLRLILVLDSPPGEDRVLRAYAAAQAEYYQALADVKPSQRKFLKGWLRRAAWIPEMP